MTLFLDLLPNSLRVKLQNISWLAHFYRKYILRMSFYYPDTSYSEAPRDDYVKVKANNDLALSLLPKVDNAVKFSIITPIYKPNLIHFQAMLDSVFNQSYCNWQLVLVDDNSNCLGVETLLKQAGLDKRVRIVRRQINGHISAASNDGLAVSDGDFIVLLDHDDLLQKDALKAVALYLQLNPDANILYSDEDKINEQGGFEQAHYKPKWSPDLLYSHNYVCHLGVYRKALLNEIGGFRLGVEGSQDYDLLLRAVKQCKEQGIIHIPYVLYHWRIAQGSTALAGSEKSYTDDAGLKALTDYFANGDSFNGEVSVESGLLSNTYKVNWPIPKEQPLVSIIIPTKNGLELVKQCIDSIYSHTDYGNFEILLVDNQSDEAESLNYFQRLAVENKIRLLAYDQPFNYSAINNYAVTQAKGNVIVLMNNDIEVLSSSWLTEMVSHCLREDIGCVGAKLYYPNETIQHGGVVLGIGGVAGHSHKYFPKEHPGYFKRLKITQNFSAVTAACLAVRKSVFEQVGGLNEKELTIAFNDVDFCLKVQQAGLRNLWSPYVEMIHHESVSRGGEDTPEKVARFNKEVAYMQQTWNDILANDPCYNPWLSQTREDFSLR